MTKYLAPNGQPSNLTHEQWHLVRTPEFKAWFGDWEEAYKTGNYDGVSKVIDSNGEPLVCYHGTGTEFYIFDKSKAHDNEGRKFGVGTGKGVFSFTDNLENAQGWMKRSKERGIYGVGSSNLKILSVFLNLKNPTSRDDFQSRLDQKFEGYTFRTQKERDKKIAEIYKEFKKEKVDGLISDFGEYTAFYPEQIKLADGTNTTFDSKNPDIRYEKGGLIANNGKKSNLTPEQYKLVRTKAFKDWFGDWENDPENASKVVDENGEPLVVWHGTSKEIKVFEKQEKLSNPHLLGRDSSIGFFFTQDKERALRYSKRQSKDIILIQSFLNLRNPYYFTSITYDSIANNFKKGNLLREHLQEIGYSDGFMIDDFYTICVYEPNQIKLADGTNTTFDGNNPDIRYEQGGMTESSSMLFWHGGNLEEFNDLIAQKNGRYEYGAGLYLTTELSVALKYSKGSRKLYLIEVERGNDIRDSYLDVNRMNEFISSYVAASKRKEINQRLAKHVSNGQIKAYIFNTVILNEKAIKPSNTVYLREFLVKNGIDYEIVNNAFGWGEDMMILYNMDLIKNKKIVKQNDSYDIDLNTFKFEQGGEVTTSDYFKNTQGEFKGVEPKLAKAILDEYSKWRKKRNKPDFITVEGIGKLSVNYESEHSSGYFKSRSLSYYFTTEKGDLIRISDHWSKSNYPRSGKLNCGMIASCYWENYGERFDYRLPSQSYSSDLIAGIINPSKLIRMRNSEDYFEQGGLINPKKAKEILEDGTVHGKELTDKQRRFMYASARQKITKAKDGLVLNRPIENSPFKSMHKKSIFEHPIIDKLAKSKGVDKSFIISQLKDGIKVEKEHTNNYGIAAHIALAHIKEDKDYYKKLKEIEK